MADKWKKKKKNGVTYHELEGSIEKVYNCATYSNAKSEKKAPDCKKAFYEVAELEKKLDNDKSYTKYDTAEKCGCGEKQLSNCIVVYYETESNFGAHTANFDGKRKDWGGKLKATEPIVRFDKPEDYKKLFMDEESAKKTGMKFYCKDKETCETEKIMRDEEIHKQAKNCDKKKKAGKKNYSIFFFIVLAVIVYFLLT